jgi:type IV secretion system protein VirD4
MRPRKTAIAALAGIATLAASLYAPGHLVFELIGITDLPVQWDTWWQYARVVDRPAYAPYALRILAAGAMGIGLPVIAWVGLLVQLSRPTLGKQATPGPRA